MRNIEYTQYWPKEEPFEYEIVELLWQYNQEVEWLHSYGITARTSLEDNSIQDYRVFKIHFDLPDEIYTLFALKFGTDKYRYTEIDI